MKDNPTLKRLFEADQKARTSAPSDPSEFQSYWTKIAKEDEKRREEVKRIAASGGLQTGRDFYHAAMIFQHGRDQSDYGLAQSYAESAINKDLEDARWLYAATTDRLLRSQGKKQKFGTQYEWVVLKEGENYYDAMLIQPYDKRTTDAVRAKYNVPKLSELKKQEVRKRRQS